MSYLIDKYPQADYIDTYCKKVLNSNNLDPKNIMVLFFTSFPWWISWLLKLRDIIVKPFRLREGSFDGYIQKAIRLQNDNEAIYEMADSHLNFSVSVRCNKIDMNIQEVCITTIVKFNNRVGKIYFTVIKPFHKVIVKYQLKIICNQL